MFGWGKEKPTQKAEIYGDNSSITQQNHSCSGDNVGRDKITNNYNHSNPHIVPIETKGHDNSDLIALLETATNK